MNIGKRIEKRLADLSWERKKLLDALPDLSPQALSNLIVRDSKRSEWDVQIANALGVSVLWLVYGDDAKYSTEHHTTEAHINSPQAKVYDFQSATMLAVSAIIETLDEPRKGELLAFAQWLADKQRAEQNSTQRAGQ